jgi:signal-transduction protein with cAMP-binding, CBS, and nucleotidyltransferase domain
MAINVGEMMSKNLETIQELVSVQEAAKNMKVKDVSSLVVVDNQNKPQGIVTERDIVRKACIDDIRTSKLCPSYLSTKFFGRWYVILSTIPA